MSETAATPHLVHTDQLEAEAARVTTLLTGLSAEDWTRPLPTCPGWTVRKAVHHIGGAHRWAKAMVDSRTFVPPRSLDLGRPTNTDALPAWLAAGAADLVGTFRATDGDTPMWSWGPDEHVRFWSRRMLHETAIHRADLELALGRSVEYDAAVAVDGIDEFLENLPNAVHFADRIKKLTGDGETLHFHATDEVVGHGDPEWLITLEPGGFRWRRAHAKGAAAVRGEVGDLYLFAWGRRKADSERLEVLGDDALLDHWVQNAAF
jgi:uncharacterized protein (TIGR03083 family)